MSHSVENVAGQMHKLTAWCFLSKDSVFSISLVIFSIVLILLKISFI